jgi:hypothetical protein
VRVRKVVRHEITSALHDQAVHIHEPEMVSGVVQIKSPSLNPLVDNINQLIDTGN